MNKTTSFILLFVIGCQAIIDEEILHQWNEFQVKFERTYKSPLEKSKRFAIFKETLKEIHIHNRLYEQGLETYQKGITQFTDWTSDEFQSHVNKVPIETINGEKITEANFTRLRDPLPDFVDWRNQHAVSDVQNQGACESCWSFSATGALESQIVLRKNEQIILSKQNLIDCAGDNYQCHGCSKGFMTGAFQFIMDYGISSENDYPYTGVQGVCRNVPKIQHRIAKYINVNNNEDDLLVAVANVGPISAALESTANFKQYSGGIFQDSSCVGQLNHAILIVGYGVDNGWPYWLVRNSWGTQWGENGYFRIIRNSPNNCGLSKFPSYPVLM